MPAAFAVGISLWFEPADPARSRYAALIDELAAELGTPRFEPHVTLLSGLEQPEPEATRLARALAMQLQPFEVRLQRPAGGEEYFRFLYAEAAASAALDRARRCAAQTFGVSSADYQPHLSLAYAEPGSLDADALRRRLVGRVEGALSCDTLGVVLTDGPPSAWRSLARFTLGG